MPNKDFKIEVSQRVRHFSGKSFEIAVAHNGRQFSTISLDADEWELVKAAVEKYIEESK